MPRTTHGMHRTPEYRAWAARFGITKDCIRSRLRNGWTMHEIATTSVTKTNSLKRKHVR